MAKLEALGQAQWTGERAGRGRRSQHVRRLVRNLPFMIGLILLVVIVGSALLPQLLTPFDPIKVNIRDRLQSPN
ncbi:MAG TPA: hypothetical protein VFX76_07825, partial [Roseiflexaceae bacterium]|nr:hypothetical protein [Roseiflexaceae bacterium]